MTVSVHQYLWAHSLHYWVFMWRLRDVLLIEEARKRGVDRKRRWRVGRKH